MPVVERVAGGHGESQADAANEIARFVTVKDDGVQHAQRVTAGVEIQPQGEGQPAPLRFAVRMFAFESHHRACRAALFDDHVFQHAFELLLREPGVIGARRAILPQQHELAVAQGDGAVALDRGDDVAAGARDAANETARVDLYAAVAFLHRDDARKPGCGSLRDHLEGTAARRGTGSEGVRRPLERAVRPPGEWPALQRNEAACCVTQRVLPGALSAARPRCSPGHALIHDRRTAVQPVNPRPRARVGCAGATAGLLRCNWRGESHGRTRGQELAP